MKRMKKDSWMPTEITIGDTEVTGVSFVGRDLRFKDGVSVYVYTHSPKFGFYPGQLIEISFLDDDDREVHCFEFEMLMDLKFVMKVGIPLDPSLLGDRDPAHLFNLTVAHYLAAKGVLSFENDRDSNQVRVSFVCGVYEDVHRMSHKVAEKFMVLPE